MNASSSKRLFLTNKINQIKMFKFNFSNAEENPDVITDENTVWSKSEEILYRNVIGDPLVDYILKNCQINLIATPSYELKHFDSKDVLEVIKSSELLPNNESIPILRAEESHSDLKRAEYEGGLKVWECTFDLLNCTTKQRIELDHKEILDLGCGAGLIGIHCLKNNANKCTFQDYNEDVLKYVTIPNVNINLERTKCEQGNIRFFSGDWQSFSNELNSKERYDYIFTSETIYNTQNYSKLHDVFLKLLKQDGAVYLAAKSYYFGVGGGVSLFQDFLRKQGVFNFRTVWKCSDGVSREILKITFR